MNSSKVVAVLVAIFAVLLASMPGTLLFAELASIGLFAYFFMSFIDSIGKTYNMMDIPILLALLQCLIMPIIVFHVYNTDLAVIALKYDMSVSAERYYGFMFPAVLLFIAGVKLPELFLTRIQTSYAVAVANSKQYLKGKGNLGLLLIIIGFVATIMEVFFPAGLKYVAYLFSKLLYVGALYTYFSDQKNRTIYLIGAILAIIAQSLAQGMFGELVYTLALGFMLIVLGKKIKPSVKFSLVAIGTIFILLLQSVKSDYRDIAWKGEGDPNQSNTGAFFSLISERINNPDQFFDWTTLFPIVNRFNQGMIVGKVMDHVPNRAPFAEGETIFTSLAASFVPRIMWPGKPTSGGHYNMERFTGFIIEGYSMNISPMGEAYGNFGAEGGAIFMFFYGLFFSLVIAGLLHVARKRPTIILWFPILFLNSIQMETDVLMCVNSMIKNLIFISLCYWASNRFLRLKL